MNIFRLSHYALSKHLSQNIPSLINMQMAASNCYFTFIKKKHKTHKYVVKNIFMKAFYDNVSCFEDDNNVGIG